MSKADDALDILRSLGLPRRQQNERSCLTLLALAGISPRTPWRKATRPLLRIWDIMRWMKEKYGKQYAPNSRETIRRQTVHPFEQARLIDRNPDNPSRPTNSGDTVYQLTNEAVAVLRRFGQPTFAAQCRKFIAQHGSLAAAYDRSRKLVKVPVTLPAGGRVELSPGAHNELQRLIIEEFAPRFAPGAMVVYVGDTAAKRLLVDDAVLTELRVPALQHDKLPDVVLYERSRNWLFLIEAVTSHGPVSPKRHAELEAVLGASPAGRIYVTALRDFAAFKKYAGDIVWESEVWIAECPDHLIHFNGDKFLGPYPQQRQRRQ